MSLENSSVVKVPSAEAILHRTALHVRKGVHAHTHTFLPAFILCFVAVLLLLHLDCSDKLLSFQSF